MYRKFSRQNYKREENTKTEEKDKKKQESIRQIQRMATKGTHRNDKRRKDASEVMAGRFRIEKKREWYEKGAKNGRRERERKRDR